MSREKQIEEMAKIFADERDQYPCRNRSCAECPYFEVDCNYCEECHHMEALYNAGYRKQEWISVDERFPEKEQIVLCCLGLVMNVYTYKGDRIWEDSYGYWQKDEPITHWMPLPEPPKMKGGE